MVAPILLRELRVPVVAIASSTLRVLRYQLLVVSKYHLLAGKEHARLQVLTLLMRCAALN
jgi:hypothetical protein